MKTQMKRNKVQNVKDHLILRKIFFIFAVFFIQVNAIDWQFIQRAPFQSISLQSSSTLVNSLATLTLSMTLPVGVYFEHQDKITVEIPRATYFINQKAFFPTPSIDPSNCFTNDANFIVDTCNIQTMNINLTISAVTPDYTASTISISFQNFQNPYSTFPLKIFNVTLVKVPALGYGADWEDSDYQRERFREKAYENTTLTLSGMLPDAIGTVSITPLNLTVAASGVFVRFSVRAKNEVRMVSMLSFYIPLWNPDEGVKGKHHILAETPYCKGIEGLGGYFSCAYNKTIQTLYIYRPVENTVPKGTVFTFEMDNFLNPYSGKPKHNFEAYTLDEDFGIVDSSEVSGQDITMTVSDWTYLPTVKILRPIISQNQRLDGSYDSSTTIRYQSAGIITIFMDLPADADCRIEVRFPADMPLTVDLQRVSSSGMLESARVVPTSINLSTRSFFLDGCSSYQPQINNTLWMYNMRNKEMVRQTESFSVYLWTRDIATGLVHKVAKKEDNIFLYETDFSVGSIVSLFVTAVDTYTIRQHTRYAVQFKTVDPIPNNSKIKIRFPTTISLVPGSCQLQNVTAPFNINANCIVTLNQVIITYPFLGSQIYDSLNGTGTSIGFSFDSGGINPQFACDAGQFLVTTFAIFNGVDYSIDYYQFYALYDKLPRFAAFIPIADKLKVVMLRPDNEMTYNVPTQYRLEIHLGIVTPQNSQLQIMFPPEIQLQEGLTSVTCRAYLTTGTVVAYSTPESYSPLTFTMTTIFTAGDYTDISTPFNLFCDNLQNPKNLNPTSSFALATYNSQGCGIERVHTGIVIQMYGLPSFHNVSVRSEVPNNGQISRLIMEFQAKVSFSNGYIIQLKFPPEVVVPDNPQCLPQTLVSQATCWKLPLNVLKAQLNFADPPVLQYIPFSFKLDNIRNPISTSPTNRFSEIIAYDKLNALITSYTEPGPILTNPQPAVAIGTLEQSDKDVGVQAEYNIKYTTVNDMPAGAGFVIIYPNTVQTLPSGLTTCLVYYQNTGYPQGWDIDAANNTIKIMRGLPIAIPAGSQLSVVFGPIVNPSYQKVLNISFTITSYVDTTFKYSIDKVSDNLFPQFTCNYPCRRCPSRQQGSVCLSCYTGFNSTLIPEQYLNGTNCVAACPSGTTPNSQSVCLGLKTSLLEISSFEANFQPSYYSIKIHPTGSNTYPSTTVINIQFPSEVKLATGETTAVCSSTVYIPPWQKYIDVGITTVITTAPIKVQISNVFLGNLQYKQGTIITLKCGKLRNPRLLDQTITDISVTLGNGDSFGGFKVQMKKLPSFLDFRIDILSLVTGLDTQYTFTFISGHEMINGQVISIDLTKDVTLLEDDPSTISVNEGIICTADGTILTAVVCTIEKICISALGASPQIQIPTGKLLATLTFANGIIQSGVTFNFRVQKIRNPPNTAPIVVQSLDVLDIDKQIIQKYSIKPFPVIKMTSAAIITTKFIQYEIATVNSLAYIKITFNTINRMPSDSNIVVTYPASAVFAQGYMVASTVIVDSVWRGSTVKVDFVRRKIVIALLKTVKPLEQEIPRGANIQVQLSPFKNIALSTTDSFQLETFTNENLRYQVDQIPSGQLFLFSCLSSQYQSNNACVNCVFPCKTCLSDTVCLTCYSDTDAINTSGQSYFYQGNCLHKVDQCSSS